MSIATIIATLAQRDIRLWLEAGALKYSAPTGALDADTRALIQARRTEIIGFLSEISASSADLPLARRPADAAIPLSVGQERLWFLARYEGASSVYNVLSTVRLDESIDLRDHRRIVARLVARHESLRTRFAEHEGVPYSVIESVVELAIPLVDLSAIDDPVARDNEIRRLVLLEERHQFDLERAPLIRSSQLRIGSNACVMLVNIHHAALDAWSMGIIGNELMVELQSLRSGAPPGFPPIEFQYSDFAYWQQEQLRSGGFDEQLAFWQQRLAGMPSLLELPTDFPRPTQKRYDGRSEVMLLPTSLGEAAKALCRGHGATLFMGLLTAFNILLSRYTGRRDIVVGTALAGRTHPDMHATVGMFTNTVVLRSQVDSGRSFTDLLLEARRTMMDAQANQDVPFRTVVEKVVTERSLSHTPLYQVSFALNNGAETVVGQLLTDHGAQYSDNDGVVSTAVKDDLSLQVRVLPQHLEFKLTYDVHLFSAQTARRMLGHYRILLEQLLQCPQAPVSTLAMIDRSEHQALVAAGENPRPGYPQHDCLHEEFARQCERTPHAIAVQHADRQLSYAALDRWSDLLAARLKAAGAGVGQRVGLCVEGALEIVCGMLAILKTGAAYVPLDRAYPRHVLDHMIEDAGLGAILSNAGNQPWTQRAEVATIGFERGPGSRARGFAAARDDDRAVHPAYVIYTSGSTGKAKGVEVSHRNVVRLVKGCDYIDIGPDDVFVQMSNHSFDAVTFEVWGALLNGARLVHVERDVLLDPPRFGAFLRECHASSMFITVALFNHLANIDPTALRTVKNMGFGGDAVDPDALRRVFEAGKPPRLMNLYGPTENTTFSTWFEFTRREDLPFCMIGKPIANSTAHVLDLDGNLVPFGVVGELFVGGDGVALGYVNRPERTAERFVPDPFSSQPGARLYRTGDRVRRGASGEIEYLGRFDNQVKIRGFRIELGEIEVQLTAHPLVSEAAVLVHVTDDGDKRLIAYLVLRGDADVAVEQVRGHLRQALPDYKQPFAYVALDTMPLTPNGKIDRSRLPAPARSARRVAVAPRDALEATIAGIWQQLLGIDQVSVDDNFFELGGHSLLAITLSVRLRDRLGTNVTTRDVFEHPTIDALSAFLRQQPGRSLPALPPIQPAGKRERTIPSFVQQRLWFVDQMEGASATYHMPLVLQLDRRFSAARVAAALATVQARHETLRTAFTEVNGMPIAVTARHRPARLRQVDLSGQGTLSQDNLQALVMRVVGQELMRPFDLSQAPLHRALLLRLPDGDSVLAITVHHIVCDGWSLGNLLRELSALLADGDAGLPTLKVQYGDYAHWYRAWLDSGVLKQQVDHWRSRLQGVPPLLSLQPQAPRPAERRHRGRTIQAGLDEALVRQVEQAAAKQGCTLFMAMLATFKVLLSHHSGLDDIVVGMPVANRPHGDLEPLIGFFANTLALRTRIVRGESFEQLLARVRETTLEAYEYQGTPFEYLVDALNPERSLGHAPLVQIVFGQENFTELDAGLAPGIRPVSLRAANRTAKFDLNLSFERLAHGAQVYCEYDSDLYAGAFVGALLAEFESSLRTFALAPATRIGELARGQQRPLEAGERLGLAQAIESALMAIDGVAEMVVVEQPDPVRGPRWIGFVVPSGSEADLGDLLQACQRAMPPQQRLALLVPLDAMPLAADGTPDRALLASRVPGTPAGTAHEPPATATEQAIAAIWGELLERTRIGRQDNFFALGGHSLLASQACARINAGLGTELRIRSFYASENLRALGECVDEELRLARMLDAIDLDALSDDEAERLLAQLQERV